MTLNEYQQLAGRTINKELTKSQLVDHALLGMSAETGELCGIYQKGYQGHIIEFEDAQKELGDILWMIAEYATAIGVDLEDIAQKNIDKLRKRYPHGFTEYDSTHREEYGAAK